MKKFLFLAFAIVLSLSAFSQKTTKIVGNAVVDGKLGVNKTTPRAKFHIYAAKTTDTLFILRNSVTGNDSGIWITPKGYVGIGTNNPIYPLVVEGNISTGSAGSFFTQANSYFSGGGYITGVSGNISLNAQGANQNILLTPSGTGSVGIGTNPSPGNCKLHVAGSGIYLTNGTGVIQWSGGQSFGYLAGVNSFYSPNYDFRIQSYNGSVVTNLFHISTANAGHTGNVGLSTTTPSYLLSLGGDADRTIGMERRTTTRTGYSLSLRSGGVKSGETDTWGSSLNSYDGLATGNATGTSFQWFTSDATTSGTADQAQTVKMTMLSTGAIGVGTATPSSKIDVAGDIETGSTNAFYFGDPTTDGTWRIIRDGDNLVSQRRESGSYVTKQTITP